jgi:hypothetical protein
MAMPGGIPIGPPFVPAAAILAKGEDVTGDTVRIACIWLVAAGEPPRDLAKLIERLVAWGVKSIGSELT